jgi:hypothetical protein
MPAGPVLVNGTLSQSATGTMIVPLDLSSGLAVAFISCYYRSADVFHRRFAQWPPELDR